MKLWIKRGIGILPWVLVMYLLFRLEQDGVWVPETPNRDMMTIGLVAAGMLGSYFLYSFLTRKR